MSARIDKFTDEEFREIVKSNYTMLDVAKALGYTSHSGSNGQRIRKRIDELGISTEHFTLGNRRPQKRCAENVFVQDSTADQKTLRKYYIKGEYTPYVCAICGQLPIWNDLPLTLILDHINGHNKDDRLENLRWVCPNCNQQLDTTNGKNIKKKRLESEQI